MTIYIIFNNLNGNYYLGSAIKFVRRVRQHKSQLRGDYHFNLHLQSAWNKYGEENFQFVEIVSLDGISHKQLLLLEDFLLKEFKPKYNMNLKASCPNSSEEGRAKQADAVSKDWIVTTPRGKEIKVRNLRKLCRKHDLNQSGLATVARGIASHYKGWKVRKAGEPTQTYIIRAKRLFRFTSPKGKVFIYLGLVDFCRKQKLSSFANFIKVIKGKRKSHLGWKCEYASEKDIVDYERKYSVKIERKK